MASAATSARAQRYGMQLLAPAACLAAMACLLTEPSPPAVATVLCCNWGAYARAVSGLPNADLVHDLVPKEATRSMGLSKHSVVVDKRKPGPSIAAAIRVAVEAVLSQPIADDQPFGDAGRLCTCCDAGDVMMHVRQFSCCQPVDHWLLCNRLGFTWSCGGMCKHWTHPATAAATHGPVRLPNCSGRGGTAGLASDQRFLHPMGHSHWLPISGTHPQLKRWPVALHMCKQPSKQPYTSQLRPSSRHVTC